MDASYLAIALSIPTFDSCPTVRSPRPLPTQDSAPTLRTEPPIPSYDSGPTQRELDAAIPELVGWEADRYVSAPIPKPSAPTLVLRRKPKGTQPPATEQQLCADAVIEAKLLAILDSPIAAIETPTQGFDRKERAIGNVLAELSTREANALLSRLMINFTCDALARKFSKLAVERQGRLLDFLRLIAA